MNRESSTVEIKVLGMSCEHCAATVRKAARSVSGVEEAAVDLEAGTLRVKGPVGAIDRSRVVEAVRAAGYETE